MSDKTNERLEQEARESLVAADLSAKMKQWRDQPPPKGSNGGGAGLRILLLLLAFGGVAGWLFWPKRERQAPLRQETPAEQPAPAPLPGAPALPQTRPPEPMAQKNTGNRYLSLAQSSYQAPDFSSDIRGTGPATQDALDDARRALAEHRPADALDALQQAPAEYASDAGYLRAHALFELKKYAQAATLFESLTKSVRYGEAAEWYGILALLPDFERNKVLIIKRLEQIKADKGHTFYREATRLYRLL